MLKERLFTSPLDKQIRVTRNMDACNETGDQYRIVHMLMTPRFDVRALVVAYYGTVKDVCSKQCSYEEAHRVVELMGLGGEATVLHGAPSYMKEPNVFIENEGTRFTVEETMKKDSWPLFVCCIGATTNLACAYLMNPEIAEKLTVIWIGGDAYPEGGFEYNLHSSAPAANVVFQPESELWQVPKSVYITMKVSSFELLSHVYPCGDISRYLVENTMRVVKYEAETMKDTSMPLGSCYLIMSCTAVAISSVGELWSLGDSPVVGLMLSHTVGRSHMIDVPRGIRDDYTYDSSKPGNRKIRVYDDTDNYFVIKDFFERMEFYLGGSGR